MLTSSVNVPSGRTFIIREQNGADDEVITSFLNSDDNELVVLDRFLTNLVLHEVVDNEKNEVLLSDVQNLLVRDKYALLIKSRIFSLGESLKFSHKFYPEDVEEEFVEDLRNYVWDYTKPFPKKGEVDYDRHRIPPYESTSPLLYSLSSGKQISFELLTAKGEANLASGPQHINRELQVRKISSGTPLQEVNNFEVFSARDMAEIRAKVREHDFLTPLTTEFDNPVTGEEVSIPLLSLPDFFFPTRL